MKPPCPLPASIWSVAAVPSVTARSGIVSGDVKSPAAIPADPVPRATATGGRKPVSILPTKTSARPAPGSRPPDPARGRRRRRLRWSRSPPARCCTPRGSCRPGQRPYLIGILGGAGARVTDPSESASSWPGCKRGAVVRGVGDRVHVGVPGLRSRARSEATVPERGSRGACAPGAIRIGGAGLSRVAPAGAGVDHGREDAGAVGAIRVGGARLQGVGPRGAGPWSRE